METKKIECPIDYSVNLLGGKWKLPIIRVLVERSPIRFKELERSVTGITPKMLTTQLRNLEENGLVNREAFPTVPPTVEYSLTEVGKTIKPMIKELEKWGLYHQNLIMKK